MNFPYCLVILLAGMNTDCGANDYMDPDNSIFLDFMRSVEAESTAPTKSTIASAVMKRTDCVESSNYVKVSKTPYYVDKTAYIRKVMEDSPYLEFCAPKMFSKSTFLSMMKTFLSSEVDNDGKIVNSTPDQRMKSTMFALFREKAVFNHHYEGKTESQAEAGVKQDSLFNLHFGKYPVLHADFSAVTATTYHQLRYGMYAAVIRACREHEYILKNETLWSESPSDLEFFKNEIFAFAGSRDRNPLLDYITSNAFLHLSKKLSQHFGENVIVLIDEVDAPTTSSLYDRGFSEQEIESVDKIMKTLLTSICKTNESYECIGKVIVTSILSLSATSSQQPANLKRYRFCQAEEYEFLFGFTYEEVKEIVEKNEITPSTRMKNYNQNNFLKRTKCWYGGYKSLNNVSIYNPWFLMNLLATGRFQRYWTIPLDQQTFVRLCIHPEILPTMWRLMNREYVEMEMKNVMIYNINVPILLIREILIESKKATPCPFFKYLCEYGFLSCNILGSNKIGMKIPNFEIHFMMDELIFSYEQANSLYAIPSYLTSYIGETITDIALSNDDTVKSKSLQELAGNLSLLHTFMDSGLRKVAEGMIEDCNVHLSEENFKWALYVILSEYFPTLKEKDICKQGVRKEVSVPGGRIDIVLTTRDVTFIIELKYGRNSKIAIEQCINNNYLSIVKPDSDTDSNELPFPYYILFGINFQKDQKKTVSISYLFNSNNKAGVKTVSTSN